MKDEPRLRIALIISGDGAWLVSRGFLSIFRDSHGRPLILTLCYVLNLTVELLQTDKASCNVHFLPISITV
jgi:hypothetical protein